MTENSAVMNNTKWEELRLAMYSTVPAPRYRCMTITDYYSDGDARVVLPLPSRRV
jgi:hypothetical protein